jgi:hypothetical protein
MIYTVVSETLHSIVLKPYGAGASIQFSNVGFDTVFTEVEEPEIKHRLVSFFYRDEPLARIEIAAYPNEKEGDLIFRARGLANEVLPALDLYKLRVSSARVIESDGVTV